MRNEAHLISLDIPDLIHIKIGLEHKIDVSGS